MSEEKNRHIILIGPDTLSNQMLMYSIKKELNIPCSIYVNSIQLFPKNMNSDYAAFSSDMYDILFLIDCIEKCTDAATKDVVTNPALIDHRIAFYNLPKYSGAEAKALTRKISGFFYVNDSMDIFLKGITSIFAGEFWISRQVLLQHVMNSPEKPSVKKPYQVELTNREQQILALVSIGVKNEEISEKLCISVNTVKTHMYNIYKKIQVTNRLQAALWAAKNL